VGVQARLHAWAERAGNAHEPKGEGGRVEITPADRILTAFAGDACDA
jgi:hypothetical protein